MTGGGRPRVAGIPVGSVERVSHAGRLLTRARSGADGGPPAATAEALDNRARLTAVIIHGFALAQGAAAAGLAQTLVGDEAALTALTVAMIMAVSRVNGRDWGVGEGLALIGAMAGFYLASRGAVFLVKWIPLLGNVANAVTSMAVAEVLGWATYLLVRENRRPGDLAEGEAREIYRRARELRGRMKDEAERLVEAMSPEDRAHYDRLIRRLKVRDLPEREREAALAELDGLVVKYGG
jgi:uncharacterized protein (DUF697 family)